MAAKLIAWDVVSLDGYLEGPDSDLSFMQYAWGPELEGFINDQARDFGTIVFGRRTYVGMAGYWQDKSDFIGTIMNRTPKVVFSHSLDEAKWANSRIARRPLEDEVAQIKQESPKNAYVLGSGELVTSLIEQHLLDELRIGLVSILLGDGKQFFGALGDRAPMKLVESRPLGDRIVLLRFVPRPTEPR